jgi:Carboxypeptidase regulatory-like domain
MNGLLSKFAWLVLLLFCLISTAVTPSVMAQSASTGALNGTVKDPSGAVIPNVKVTATSATGATRTATTSADGTYSIGLLPPGTYGVKFEAPGFQTTEVPSVTVTVTETGTLDETLQVGAQTQEVTVQANVEAVQTTNATVGTTIGSQAVSSLPLNTRDYINLLSLSAGANANVENAGSLGKGSQDIAVNGASTGQNNYQMDGVPIDSFGAGGGVGENGTRGAFGIPNPDAIQEFRIQTSQYDAGYGRNPGANVNVVTKSGTNDFHGSLWEFFRNTDLNANNFFNNLHGAPRGALDQNQFGGVFGGPVKKDKLFFFVSYQETRQKNGVDPAGGGFSAPILPSFAAVQGGTNFNSAGSRGTCPLSATTVAGCDATAQAFAAALGNVFKSQPTFGCELAGAACPFIGGEQVAANGSNINPTAMRLLQLTFGGHYYVPFANGANTAPGVSCLAFSCTAVDPSKYKEHQAVGNWDYVINGKNTLSGRYFYSIDPSVRPFGNNFGATFPGDFYNPEWINHEAVLKLTTIVSSSLVNELSVSYQRNATLGNNSTSFTNTGVGLTPVVTGPAGSPGAIVSNELTSISIGGFPSARSSSELRTTHRTKARSRTRFPGRTASTRFVPVSEPNTTGGSFTFPVLKSAA